MSVNVTVYTSSGCPHCFKIKEQLKEWGILYEERNVSENREYFEELQKKRIFGTPATYIHGKVVLGFQAEKMEKLLEMNGETIFKVEQKSEKSIPNSDNDDNDGFLQPVDQNIFNEVYDFVSIGAGPAGASAAVYAARGKLKTLVIDKAPKAGTLAITHKIAKSEKNLPVWSC